MDRRYRKHEEPEYDQDYYDDWADLIFHSIRDGDRSCCVCGEPSYTMIQRKIYCFKHKSNSVPPETGVTPEGEQNESATEVRNRAGVS